MRIKLPNGLYDGGDLFNFAEIDELRGKQQNYLADRELVVGNIGHVPMILKDMIKSLETKEGLAWKGSINDAVEKLPSGDLETILIKIRENTYGNRYYFESQCPHCKHDNKNLRLDLDKLDMDEMTLDEMMESKEIELPKSRLKISLKPAYLNDLFKIIKITQGKGDTLITSLLAVSIKNVGTPVKDASGNETYQYSNTISEKDVENIPMSDLMVLQDKVQKIKLEGNIDTNVENTCSNCGKDFEFKLNVFEPSFFDPTRGSTS